MKEQPLFAQGQDLICINRLNGPTAANQFMQNDLIEGKKYPVVNACARLAYGRVYIEVEGSKFLQWQKQFVPASFDRYAEETFHQSLKGKPVNA